MTALLLAVFVTSLVGSLHCAGMCGGVVALCVNGQPTAHRIERMAPHLVYNLGRLATYAALGAVSGAIGAAINLGGSAVGVSRIMAFAAGGLMICFGLIALIRTRRALVGAMRLPEPLRSIFQRGFQAVKDRPPVTRSAIIGLLTGFLPCGWLYAFVITAAGTGHAALGAMVMVAFWAGTLPVMLTLGVSVQAIAAPLRRHVPTITAVALVVLGVVAVVGRLNVPAYADSIAVDSPQVTPEESIDRMRSQESTPPPCCNDAP